MAPTVASSQSTWTFKVHRLDGGPALREVTLTQDVGARPIAEVLAQPGLVDRARPVTLLILLGTINHPDELSVQRVVTQDHALQVDAELREFVGPLFANTRHPVILEVGPLLLEGESWSVDIRIQHVSFGGISRPDLATPDIVTSLHYAVP